MKKSDSVLSRRPSNDLWEMELIGDHSILIGVPIDADLDLKKKIIGAIKTYLLRGRSVDYVIKRYGKAWEFSPPEKDRLFFLHSLRAADRLTENIANSLMSGKDRPDNVGLFVAEMALVRLKASFRSAILLMMQGYPFESATMCRLILEQYGFAYYIKNMSDAERILKVNPTKTISNLKKLFPYAGKMYGHLSSRSHLDPKDNRHFIKMESSGVVVRYKMPEETKIVLYYFLRLVIDYKLIANEISGEYIKNDEVGDDESIINNDVESVTNAFNALESEVVG